MNVFWIKIFEVAAAAGPTSFIQADDAANALGPNAAAGSF